MPDDGLKDDGLRYDRMVEEALRSVVRRSLTYAAKHGLQDDHHFYITFRTDDPGTQVPPRLRERYPNEMTIVLQYQFWDLEVSEEGFSVALSFGEVAEKLVVPFPAVVAFADPSVQFGLQFDVANGEGAAAPSSGEEAEADLESAANGASSSPSKGKAPAHSENVVPLDTFRKKST